jgi:hypothetical protein
MKNFRFFAIVFLLLVLPVSFYSQSRRVDPPKINKYPAPKDDKYNPPKDDKYDPSKGGDGYAMPPLHFIHEPRAAGAKSKVAVVVYDKAITKVMIISAGGKSSIMEFEEGDSYSFFLPVSLEVGDNDFNILAFIGKNVSYHSPGFTIKRRKPVKVEDDDDSGDEETPADPDDSDDTDDANAGKDPKKDPKKDPTKVEPAATKPAISVSNLKNIADEPNVTGDPDFVLEILPENLPDGAETIRVEVTKGKGYKKTEDFTIMKTGGKPNSPQKVQIGLVKGVNNLALSVLGKDARAISGISASAKITCDPCEVEGRNINTRAIVGMEQVGASSANSETLPFLNFFMNVPISKTTRGVAPRFSIWADFRFSASTVQSFANLSNITTSVISPIFGSDASINNIVQSFRINTGIDVKIIKEKSFNPFFTQGKSSISFIAGGGVTSPITATREPSLTFKIPRDPTTMEVLQEFKDLFPYINFTADKKKISFVSPERDRFFRRWFAGLRLKTFFFDKDENPLALSPATLDITVGQDEAITKKLTKKILTFDGFTPFPIRNLDYIYLFGSINLALTRKVNTDVPSFFLEQAAFDPENPSETVIVSSDSNRLTISNRDTFKFGIGIDLIRLFTRQREAKQAAAAAPDPTEKN